MTLSLSFDFTFTALQRTVNSNNNLFCTWLVKFNKQTTISMTLCAFDSAPVTRFGLRPCDARGRCWAAPLALVCVVRLSWSSPTGCGCSCDCRRQSWRRSQPRLMIPEDRLGDMEETGGARAYGAPLAGGGFDFYKFIRQPQTIVRVLSWVSVLRCGRVRVDSTLPPVPHTVQGFR